MLDRATAGNRRSRIGWSPVYRSDDRLSRSFAPIVFGTRFVWGVRDRDDPCLVPRTVPETSGGDPKWRVLVARGTPLRKQGRDKIAPGLGECRGTPGEFWTSRIAAEFWTSRIVAEFRTCRILSVRNRPDQQGTGWIADLALASVSNTADSRWSLAPGSEAQWLRCRGLSSGLGRNGFSARAESGSPVPVSRRRGTILHLARARCG